MSFFQELKRRNVFRVGAAYVLIAWVVLQIIDFMLELTDAPSWVLQVFFIAAAVGLPIALIFAWIFEMTPEGIKREVDVERDTSIAPQTGHKLDRTIIAFLAVAVVLLLADRFMQGPEKGSKPFSETSTSRVAESPQQEGSDPFSSDSKPSVAAVAQPEKGADPSLVRSIAVLPFLNMSADADNEYFSDGISEEILNVLAAVPDLKVASRTSAFRYRGSELSIAEIAAELGVSYVLEGSVRKSGDQVRITAQLIQAEDGFHLWSDSYDRELDNIFIIQDEIASNIAEMLQVQILGESKAYTTAEDLSPENYEKFLKARFLMRQRNELAVSEALDLTRSVLSDNPDFPAGMMLVAEALVQTGRFDDTDNREAIKTLADRALALEPDLAAAHMINGEIAMNDWRPLQAIRYFEKAIELDPAEPRPHHWLGILLANSGYLEQAREELQIAVDLEPDHANANGYLGFVLLLQGDYDRAQHHFDLQDRLGNPFGGQRRVQIAVLKGDLELAGQLLDDQAGFNAREATRLRLFMAAVRNPETVDAYLENIDDSPGDDWHMALELMILGQYERALAFHLGGYPRSSWSDRFAAARALPAFEQKVLNARLFEVWDALGPPPACRKVADGYDCAPENSP